MENKEYYSNNLSIEDAKLAKDRLMTLGLIAVGVSAIDRVPRYPDGNRENDAEHSFHLALSATEIAAEYYPELDAGLISQFSLIHDLPEIYTGDVCTYKISEEDRSSKESAEQIATERLLKELPVYTSSLLMRYEEQLEPEARFVRLIDKLMPSIMNITAGNACTHMEDFNIKDLDSFNKSLKNHHSRIRKMFPEFPMVLTILDLLEDDLKAHFFKKDT